MDPIDFRLKNCLRLGDETPHGQVLTESVGLTECLTRVRDNSDWDRKRREFPANNQGSDRRKGIGVAALFHGVSLGAEGEDYAASTIEVNDDGLIRVYSTAKSDIDTALRMIKHHTADLEVGKTYRGTVVSVKDFGAFVRVFASTEGLVHISELEHSRVNKVTDVLNEGDEVVVKVLDVDRNGKIRLSRKAALGTSADDIEN